MSIEPIGVLTFVVGLLCLVYGPSFTIFSLLLGSLFGAATVLKGPSGNFLPAQVLVMFALVDLASRPRLLKRGLEGLAPLGAGFWLLLTVLYSAPTALILPRLFAERLLVVPIHITVAVPVVPLEPSSANFSQVVYLFSDLVCFAVVSAYVRAEKNLWAFARAGIALAFTHVSLGILDFVTYSTHTGFLLDFIRNADYSLLIEAESDGLKRIVGSFSEASAYGTVAADVFAFTLSLWLRGVYPRASGFACLAALVAAVLSTSSTAYLTLVAIFILPFLLAASDLVRKRATGRTIVLLFFLPLIGLIAGLAVYGYDPARQQVVSILDSAILTKLDSDSGVQRSSWNAEALSAFFNTYGLGVGVGSLRASSMALAIPASLGIFGTATYSLFFLFVFVERINGGSKKSAHIRLAAKITCFAQLFASALSGGTDPGLLFFMMAAVATSARDAGLRAPSAYSEAESVDPAFTT